MRTVHGYRHQPAWRTHCDNTLDAALQRPADWIGAALLAAIVLGAVGWALRR